MAEFDFETFERATEVMARMLAQFRVGEPCADVEPSDIEKLEAGLLAGALSAQGLLVGHT